VTGLPWIMSLLRLLVPSSALGGPWRRLGRLHRGAGNDPRRTEICWEDMAHAGRATTRQGLDGVKSCPNPAPTARRGDRMSATPHPLRICALERAFDPEEPRAKPIRQTNVEGLSTTEFAVNRASPESRLAVTRPSGNPDEARRQVRNRKWQAQNDRLRAAPRRDWRRRRGAVRDTARFYEITARARDIAALSQRCPHSGQLYAFLKAAKPFGTSNR